MNEVFTKKFWREVKKTFDEAREGASPEKNTANAPAAIDPNPSEAAVNPPSPSATNEQAKTAADE